MPEVVGKRRIFLGAVIAFLLLGAFAAHHVVQFVDEASKRNFDNLLIINVMMFVWLAGQLMLAYTHRDVEGPEPRRFISVVMTVFNEDPTTFLECLRSIGAQTRLPDRLWVTDDGSGSSRCQEVFNTWRETECPPGMDVRFHWQNNAGKRSAQAHAFRSDQDADIFLTIDSDTTLDPKAVERGILPFNDKRVASVAGLLVGLNYSTNLLTKLIDISFVVSFLNGRASWSRVGSVAVNCGALAFYRARVVHKHLDHYLSQKVIGRDVQAGDDAMMTRYAMLEGRSVFQSSSVGYTLLPERITHLSKQRVRWWRSFFWGNVWLLWRFPITKLVWWMTLYKFLSFVFMSMILPWAIFVVPVVFRTFGWGIVAVMVLLSYVQASLYLTVRRPDQSLRSQLALFALSPLSTLLNAWLIWVLQYVGLFTFAKTGWSTRQKVEVGLDTADAPALAEAGQTQFLPAVGELEPEPAVAS